jgi:hypothetical protein
MVRTDHRFLWSLLGLGALLALLSSLPTQRAAAEEAEAQLVPHIEVSETTFDFGSMYQNEAVSHTFRIRNTGTATLKLEQVKSTCGCTAALPAQREIAPGGETDLKVTFQSGSMRDRIVKHVHIDSNDPAQPRVTLTITGQVKVEIEVSPRGIYIGKLGIGEVVERTVEITPVDVKSFRLLGATSDHPAVKVSKPAPLPDREPGYRLTITFGPLKEPGRVNAKVTVRTNLPHTKEFEILIYGRVSGPADEKQPSQPE